MSSSAQELYPLSAAFGAGRILIAGVGNIFMGDDAFGCEVASELLKKPLPENVVVHDFGIRSYDLACALVEDYRAIILIDAVSRGEAPGTVFLIEPEIRTADLLGSAGVDPHSMNVMTALQSANALGRITARVYLIGCEPAAVESADGHLGLSEPVRAAVPQAATMIQSLLSELLERIGAESTLVD